MTMLAAINSGHGERGNLHSRTRGAKNALSHADEVS